MMLSSDKKVVIIDYGSGNLHSTVKSFQKASDISGHEVVVSSNPFDLKTASHIVLPGVGAFGDCMDGLLSIDGMIQALEREVLEHKKPFLGICVGMQLLASTSTEHTKHDNHKGLGWINATVVEIPANHEGESFKVPHMGWNELEFCNSHPIISTIDESSHAYFVHSYHVQCSDKNDIIAQVGYGDKITAIIAKDNIIGTQFHPEKSQKTGQKIIHNFLSMVL